ncbi:hypothetical protein ACI3PL_25210, partial [Lacticaseibacillus paracasei]
MVKCAFCSSEFQPRAGNRPKRFCSKKCADKFYFSLKPKTVAVSKQCLFCDSDFESPIKQQKFCSKNC